MCRHSFLEVFTEFGIEWTVVGIAGEEATFGRAEKTTGRMVGIVH